MFDHRTSPLDHLSAFALTFGAGFLCACAVQLYGNWTAQRSQANGAPAPAPAPHA